MKTKRIAVRAALVVLLALAAFPSAQSEQPLDTLRRIRAEYPTPMAPAQLAAMLNRVAWVHRDSPWRLGLLRKTGGNRCPAPQGVEVSCDILVSQANGHHYDVLVAQEAGADPVWNDVGPIDLGRFVAPVDGGDSAPPPPPPPPPVFDPAPLLNRLAELERQNQSDEARHVLIGEALAAANEQVDTLNRRIADLENVISNMPKPPVRCRATVLGFRVSCQLEY